MTKKAKILVVEDESVVALNIENRLSYLGYEISAVVTTGEEAIAEAAKRQPDLVLMDIQLTGEIDGIEAAELICDRCNIPVIYLTAYGDEETLQRAKITEPYSYIIKPFEAIDLGSAIEISLYKHRIDGELKSREQWLSTTLTSIGDGVITTDKGGAIAFMNPVAENLTGWHHSEALGNPLSEVFRIVDENTGELAENPAENALQSGAKVALENHTILIAKDGTKIPIDDSAAPIKDEKENVTGAVLVFHDIIERKQAELALRNSEERFRSIFDQAFNLMWLLQPDGTVLSANQTVLDLGEIQERSVKGCLFWQGNWWRLSTATSEELSSAVGRSAAGEIVRCEVESRVENSGDESDVFIDLSIKPITGPTGKVVLLIAEGKDISDRKRAEAQLQRMNDELEKRVAERTAELQQTVKQLEAEIAEHEKSKRFNQRIADTTPNILYIYDLIEQRNIYTNRQITTILGYRPEEIQKMGQTFLQDLMHPEDFAKLPKHFSKFDLATEGQIFENEYRMRDVKGQWRWLVSRDTLFSRTTDGKPQQIIGAADDITDRKQAEETLKLSRSAIAASNNGIIICDARDPDLPAIYVNPAFEEMTGYTAAETIGRNCPFLQGLKTEQPELDQLRAALTAGTGGTVTLRNYRKDGSMFWNNLTVSPIYDEEGNLTHYIGIQTDITERKEAEDSLRATTSRLTALMENLQLGVLVKDESGKIVLTNQAFCDLLKIPATPQVMRGADFSEFALNYQHLFANEAEFVQRHNEIIQAKQVVMGEELQMASGQTLEQDYAPIFVDGNYSGYLWMYRDITDRKQAEKELEQAKDQLQAVLDAVPGLVSWISCPFDEDLFSLEYIGVNQNLATSFNLAPEAFVGQKIGFMKNSTPFAKLIRQFFADDAEQIFQEVTIVVNNQERDYLIVAQKYNDDRAAVTVGIDITARKQAEELLKASLVEKETLLKEIHHRVKNNLQIISSLLRLQSPKIKDPLALKVFTESQNRMQVMALVHEQLYQSENLADINFPEYIKILVGNLFRSYGPHPGVTFKVNIEEISLAIDTAIPCGLIVNELVSNSLKYAFPEGRTGWICIDLTASATDEYILSIRDNGVGIPAELDWTQTESLGLQLVRRLTNQLEGEISLDRSQGTEFRLIFGTLTHK